MADARSPAMTPNTGSALLRAVVDDRERKRELVVRLPDGETSVAHVTQRPPCALGERLAAKPRERLRRAEPLRGAADEQHARRG